MPISTAEFLEDVDNFLVLPTVSLTVNQMADDPNCSAIDIANEVGKDPALTAQILRVANSAFYNFPSRIDSLTRAISIIGTDDLRNLVLMLSVVNSTGKLSNVSINIDNFWRHSFFVGLMSRRLAREVRTPLINKERLFVAGVLHEIGRLVFAIKIPEIFMVIQERALQRVEPFFEVEKLAFGLSQSEVTSELLAKWRFPPMMVELLRVQHRPTQSDDQRLEASILLLANFASAELGLPGIGDDCETEETGKALKYAGLNQDQVLEIANMAREEYFSMLSGFYTPRQQIA